MLDPRGDRRVRPRRVRALLPHRARRAPRRAEPRGRRARRSSGRTGTSARRTASTPVTRGLHVGFRAPDRARRRRLLAGRDRRRSPERRRTRAAHGLQPRLLRRLPARPGRQQRRGGSRRPRAPRARRWHRPPAGSASATRRRRGASTRRSRHMPGSASRATSRNVCGSPAPTSPSRLCATSPRSPSTSTSPSPRTRTTRCVHSRAAALAAGYEGPRRPRRARYIPPGLLRRVRARPGRPQRRGRQPQLLSARLGFRSLPNDIGRSFVVAQPEEARLTQPTFARPFGKSDLCDKLRPRPVCSGRDRPGIDER